MTNQNLIPQSLLHESPADNWTGGVACILLEDYIFLIKRSESVPSHKGQVAMPGGHREMGEDDPRVTAAREFEEETYISENHLDFLGYLPFTVTNRKTIIAPVVFRFNESKEFFCEHLKSHEEWDHAFFLKSSTIKDLSNWSYARRIDNGLEMPLYFHPLTEDDVEVLYGPDRQFLLWGATARIIWDLLGSL